MHVLAPACAFMDEQTEKHADYTMAEDKTRNNQAVFRSLLPVERYTLITHTLNRNLQQAFAFPVVTDKPAMADSLPGGSGNNSKAVNAAYLAVCRKGQVIAKRTKPITI